MCRLRLTHTARPWVYSPGMLHVLKKPYLWFVNPKKLHVASVYEINFLKLVIIIPPTNEVAGIYSDPYVRPFVRPSIPPNL